METGWNRKHQQLHGSTGCEKQQLTLSKGAPKVFNFNMNLPHAVVNHTTLERCILCMSEIEIHSLILEVSALKNVHSMLV